MGKDKKMATNEYIIIYHYTDYNGWGVGRALYTGHDVTIKSLAKLEQDLKKENNFRQVTVTNIINLNKL